jgi:Tol biopolymer transport system component
MAKRSFFAGLLAVSVVGSAGAAGPIQPVHFWSPAWSPDGKRIAFVSNRDGSDFGNVYVASADGSDLRRVSNDEFGKTGVAWSPNGKWIAYQAYAYIDEVSPDGRQHRRLTGYGGTQPDFSPSGRRIVYANGAAEFYSSIYVMRPDGSKKVPAALPRESESLAEPTWSPDGQELAFGVGTAADTNFITPYLAIINQYRGKRTRLAVGHTIYSADWSPSGRKLLLVEDPRVNDPRGNTRISVLDLRTRRLHFLGRHATFTARWSPSGRRILFENGGRLFIMNADGSNVREIAPS